MVLWVFLVVIEEVLYVFKVVLVSGPLGDSSGSL